MRCFLALLPLLGAALVGAQWPNPNNQYNNQNNQNNNQNNNPNFPQNQLNQNNRIQNGQLQPLQQANVNGQNPNNNPQSQFQNYQQSQFQNGQQNQRPNGAFVNTLPLVNTFPDPNQQNQTGAVITLQLKSYSNPYLRLPGGMTCSCPSGLQCPYLRTTGPQCFFSFTTIISAPDMSVQYIATEFVPLDNNGNIDLTRTTSNWTVPQTLYLSSKPTAIDIFVHHLGLVINQQTAALQFYNNLVHVDTFIQPLNNYLPGTSNQNPVTNSVTLTGQMSQTTLSISYSVQCRNNYIGPNCDLTCTPSASNSQNAVCFSNVTGFYSICSYQSGQQVSNCQPCQNGVTDGQCTGNVVMTSQTASSSSSFKTWTIVLGCLLGLALLFIIALIVFVIVTRNKESAPAYRAPPPPTNTWSKPAAARPLLSDPYPNKAEQNSQDWGYQPHVVSVNNQRSAPIADHEASRHSQSTNDDQNSHSSYTNNRPANGNPVALARREAQV